MADGKYRLITRSDFDGLVCGALLKELDLIDDVLFAHPKDMQDGKVPVTDRDIICNLPHVPGAGLTFDHHSSELERKGEQVVIDLGAAGRIEAWTPQPLAAGDNAQVALRAENIRLGERGPANSFTGKVIERRYQGMQTIYDVEFGGQKVEVLELGTAARHNDGEVALTLPPDSCWAYRDDGQATVD